MDFTADDKRFLADAVRRNPQMSEQQQQELAAALVVRMALRHVKTALGEHKTHEADQAAKAAKQFFTLRTPKRPGKRKGSSWTFGFHVLLSDLPAFAQAAGVNQDKLMAVAMGECETAAGWTQGARTLSPYQLGKAWQAPRKERPSIADLTATDLPSPTRTPDRNVVYDEIPRFWHPGDTLLPAIPELALDLSAGTPPTATVAKHAM